MKIGIQENLEEVYKALKNKGYNVTNNKESVDMYIYDGKDFGGVFNSVHNDDQGVLMINCNNKNISDIEFMINQKKYSNLF
ncbi:uncharacterized protein UPF0180 [Natranaerovirga pectinivora]|uniref:Uncharacterized protein UPF0180 n=1 Tax=Natranaerovirga pectinivora TaxID=682400 RepID=A0A4R3MGE5_9FIRM|nr:YkuS family protein [Natranaerovirga pectinivora]TCT12259.1 uncharacterized protein UPF0180 [Natranaerovirga pectinivora]